MQLREEADEIREKLNAAGRIDPITREHFARYCHELFNELDELGRGHVRDVIASVFPKEGDPSKRRSRFSKTGRDASKHLSATGRTWADIVTAAGRKLGREHRALIDMVVGTKYATNPEARSLTCLDDAASETAHLLNRMAAACVQKKYLGDYFKAVRYSLYEIDDQQIALTGLVPEAVDLDRLADGLWIDTELASEKAFLPKVDIYTHKIYVDALGTRPDLVWNDVSGSADIQQILDDLAQSNGTEDCNVELRVDVAIGVAPIGMKRSPVGCFVVEARAFVTIDGQSVEMFPTSEDLWTAVRHGDRCFGVRIKSRPRNSLGWTDQIGNYLLESVNRESCLKWLPGVTRKDQYDFDYKIWGWDFDDPLTEANITPTSAPSSSIMAVVQSNLAWVPHEQKISTLLWADAERLVSLLADAQAQDRRRYREAIRPLLKEWESGHDG